MDNLVIPEKIYEELIRHCREEAPYEACGILAGRGIGVTVAYRMTNAERSSVSYIMDSGEQFRVMKEMRAENLSMLAIYHSHPSSPAYPSSKDVSLAFYEDALYIIVSLAEEEPVVKCFRISNGEIRERGIIINRT